MLEQSKCWLKGSYQTPIVHNFAYSLSLPCPRGRRNHSSVIGAIVTVLVFWAVFINCADHLNSMLSVILIVHNPAHWIGSQSKTLLLNSGVGAENVSLQTVNMLSPNRISLVH